MWFEVEDLRGAVILVADCQQTAFGFVDVFPALKGEIFYLVGAVFSSDSAEQMPSAVIANYRRVFDRVERIAGTLQGGH